MIPLIQKGIEYQRVYVDLHKFEQQSEWEVASRWPRMVARRQRFSFRPAAVRTLAAEIRPAPALRTRHAQ
jgi:hypothetical protein